MPNDSIRTISPMSAFTLYIDDQTKLKTIKKLKAIGIDEKKGALAATIRTLMSHIAEGAFDELIEGNLADAIKAEYIFTTKKNKRSSL